MLSKGIKLPFGFKDGKLVHISDAAGGLNCGCVCPSCGDRLIARKGARVTHHFAHKSEIVCQHGVETAMHLAAKEILSVNRRIAIPSAEIRFNAYRSPIEISPARYIELDSVVSEKRTGSIVPDILAHAQSIPLLIEVYVTHAVNEIKLKKIRELDISALEIDLSSLSRAFAMDELADAVVNRTTNKKWLFNSKATSYHAELIGTGEVKAITFRRSATHVDDCPRRVRSWEGKSYANVIDD